MNAKCLIYLFNMKTKLLNKVRKRFKITKWEKIDNPRHWLYGSKLPLYVAKDTKENYSGYVFKTYDEAYEKLVKMIRIKYYDKMKRDYNRRNKFKKVWYKDGENN